MKIASFLKAVALVVLLAVAVGAWGQVDHGNITGTITDPSGAVIPGAQITATNTAIGVIYPSKSNDAGIYTILNLPIGTYNLRYQKEGFGAFERNGVEVSIGQRLDIDVKLSVGAAAQTVTVSGATPLLSHSTVMGTNLTSKVATDLPLSVSGGRDITSFAFAITPTVSGNTFQAHIGGSQDFSDEVLIDGTTADAGIVGDEGESAPSMDAVQQFQVDTSGISAEAGRTGGGAFEYTLKSGTNQLHGSAFGFLANEILDANSWSNKYFLAANTAMDPVNKALYDQQYRTPRDRFFDYGGSAGGPIWRNHMFIFGTIERYMQSQFGESDGTATVPTPAFLNGDFSALLQTSQPPLGTDAAGNPIYPGAIYDPDTGDVFRGNVIPANRISPVSQKIINLYNQYYKATINGPVINNYPSLNSPSDPKFTQTQVSIKWDYDVTNKNRLSASYIYVLRPRINNSLSGTSLWQAGSQNGGPLTQAALQTVITNEYRASDSYTFSPNVLNVLSLTFNQFANKSTGEQILSGNTNWPSELGFDQYDPTHLFPTISFGGSVNGVGETQIGNGRIGGYVSYNEALNDTLTWLKGRNNFKFGTELRGLGVNDDVIGGPLNFNFSNLTGAPLNSSIQSKTGFGFANFELGDVYSASQATPFNTYGRRKEYAFFGEDTIKATPRLTLDFAARWDIPMPLHEIHGYWSNFVTNYLNPNFAPYSGSLVYLSNGGQSFETYKNFWQFSPHVGLSYQLASNIVVHASYGIYYVPLGNNFYEAVPYGATTGYQAVNVVNPPAKQTSINFNWDNGYPGKDVFPVRDNNGTYIPYGPASDDPNSLTMGYTQNWNLGVEYQFAKDTVLKVSYIGNIGRKLHDGALNPLNFPTWSRYSALYNSGSYPGANVYDYVSDPASAAAAGVPYPYSGFAGAAYQAINPYPQVAQTYGPVDFVNSPLGQSTYNAFVVEIVKRASNGLSLDMSYIGSRALGNTETAFIDTYTSNYFFQDPYQYKQYASRPVSYDIPHEVKGYIDYKLPFGHGRPFLSTGRWNDLLLGGIHIAAVVDYVPEGSPIYVVGAQNYYPGWSGVFTNVVAHPNFSRPFKRVNLLWNPANGPDPGSTFVDPANFSNPPDGQLGNSPTYFNNWHYFGYATENMAVHKDFGFGTDDRYRVELRAEFFDVFNRHYNGGPNLNIGSSYFGHVTSVSGNRTGQLGARFEF